MITTHNFTKDWLLSVNKNLGWSRQENQLSNANSDRWFFVGETFAFVFSLFFSASVE